MKNQPQNIHIGSGIMAGTGYVAICWEDNENRFHVWANSKTLITQNIIYKNPRHRPSPPHRLTTRRLRAGSKTWAPIVAAVIAEVRERSLIDAWRARQSLEPKSKDVGEAVAREMVSYVRLVYGREPTQKEIERLYDAFANEADFMYGFFYG